MTEHSAIERYIEALETKDFKALGDLFQTGITATTAPTERPSTNTISTEKKQSLCFFRISFCSASIPS